MNRTVPRATSDEIQLYRSTLYSLLRSTAEVKIRTLEGVHVGMNSLMHPLAKEMEPDISAFIYSAMRLPDPIPDVRLVLIGQNADVLCRNGYPDVDSWRPVSARARRRRCFYDGKETLACYIASRSDIEDVIPCLTAYQIEWNKMHALSARWPKDVDLEEMEDGEYMLALLSDTLGIAVEDLQRLRIIWRDQFVPTMKAVFQRELSFSVKLLGGSLAQYIKATHEWFENIRSAFPTLSDRPLYFVSSNTHSIANVLTGFALRYEDDLDGYIRDLVGDPELQAEWAHIQSRMTRASRENFLYYMLKKYQSTQKGARLAEAQLNDEREHGILRIDPAHTFEVEGQIIDLKKLDFSRIDPRLLNGGDLSLLAKSDAIILNIDYPLGVAAYNILSTVSIHTNLHGIYSMGKSASLNAARGDVIIPNVVQDEHSHNTYLFDNCFKASDVLPYLKYGSVLDNQKAICVLGTFLQNAHIMDVFYSESFGDIEMELGNFCSALYEATRPKRYPTDEIVHLHNTGLDFGVLHYVSDTPMSKGKNLGAGTLSYFGMDSTYACSIAILKRIFELECQRA
jgi:hypothetical protein